MSKRIVRRIPNLPSPQLSFKAVGIYARVSTQRPSQFSSISSQISALVQQVIIHINGSWPMYILIFQAEEMLRIVRNSSECSMIVGKKSSISF